MKKNVGLNTSVHCGILQKYLCKNRQINLLLGVLNIKTSCTSLLGCLDQVTTLILFSEKIKIINASLSAFSGYSAYEVVLYSAD